MKTPFVRLLLLLLILSCVRGLRAQAPTPFGTPSLLPVQDHYANWQSDRLAYPQRQPIAPVSTRPMNMAPNPMVTNPMGQVPPAYYTPPGVPMQYAAARMQTPATPNLPPHAGAAGQTQLPAEPLAPNLQRSRSSLYSNAPGTGLSNAPGTGQYGYGSDCETGCETGCGPAYGGGCESPCYDACAPVCCGPCFYANVGGLYFTRNRSRFQQISYDDTNLVGQVLSTDSGTGRWDLGGLATFGWYLNPCCGTALEVTYWGVYGDMVETSVYATSLAGNLNSALDFSPLNIGAQNVNDLFDAAQMHEIRRDYDVHNVEVNLWGGRFPGMNCSCFQVSYLGGFRYLRFSEDFFYASANAAPSLGADPANDAYYDIQVENNLLGFQLGGRADWFVTPRLSLYAAPKFGLYANYMEHHSLIHNGNGTAVVGAGNPLVGGVYDIDSDKTIASFIGEIDLGLSYQFMPCLGASIGYRALAISGLAYSTDQIPSHFADLPGVAMIDSNSEMILHGGYAAVTLTW